MGKKSPFAPGFLGVDLYYDDQWNSVGADLLDGDLDQTGITVRHGAGSEGGAMEPSSLAFRVRNGDGKYNPRNPSSPLYGKIGRNTPARATVALGAAYADIPAGGRMYVSDEAALRPTGDIDIRWWGEFEISNSTDVIMAKDGPSPDRGWSMTTDLNGNLVLWWYPDGTSASSKFAQSSAPIPAWAGEIALRATLDVNNGAGGWTARFYYATSLDGPWVPFGTSTGTGATALFASTAVLQVGPGSSTSRPTGHKVYGFEYRLGIDAEPVSSYRFERSAPGYSRGTTVRRWNYFFDPAPAGPAAMWSDGTNARVGVVDDPVHGMVVESYKKTTAQAFPSMTGHAFAFGTGIGLDVAFDVLYEGPPGATGVNFLYRPAGAGSVTGQSIVVSGLQNYTTWTRVKASFNTGATAPVAGAGFGVLLSGTVPAGARVLMRNIVITQNADTSPFSGGSLNTPEYTYAWAGGRWVAPTAEYLSVASTSANQFTDDLGRRWNRTGVPGSVTNRHTVAVGEVAEWPLEWGKKGAPTVMTDVVASGVSRRLGQGQRPLNSPIYNAIMALPNLLAYWPMEDGAEATRFGQAVGPHYLGWVGDPPSMASAENFPGSKPLPSLGGGSGTGTRLRGVIRQPSDWTVSAIQARMFVGFPTAPLAADRRLFALNMDARTPSGVAYVELWQLTTGSLRMVGYDNEGTLKNDTGGVAFNVHGKNAMVGFSLEVTGSLEVTAKMEILDLATGGFFHADVWTGRSLWPTAEFLVNPERSIVFADHVFGHAHVSREISSLHVVSSDVFKAYDGESAEARLRRLALEKGEIPLVLAGSQDATSPMGAQEISAWLDVTRSVEAADGGVLHDNPEGLGFKYRTHRSLLDQPATVIEYEDNKILPFEPVDDDAMIRNQVIRDRPEGTSVTVSREGGPLSVLEVPTGVGIYEDSQTVNVGTNDALTDLANWDLHIGTWDEGRYPTLGVDLADPRVSSDPVLVRELLALKVGDRLVINNPPAWLPPFAADVLVMGVQMSIDPLHARLTWTCVPARPYRAGYWSAGHRWSGEGTTLTSAVTTTATTLPLTLPEEVTWTHADGDYDIIVGGERMTVTNVTGGNSMTVVRSVNGVVKAHSAGDAVSLAEPSFYARRGI